MGTLAEERNFALQIPAELWDSEPLGTGLDTNTNGRRWTSTVGPGYKCLTCSDSLWRSLSLFNIKTRYPPLKHTHESMTVLKSERSEDAHLLAMLPLWLHLLFNLVFSLWSWYHIVCIHLSCLFIFIFYLFFFSYIISFLFLEFEQFLIQDLHIHPNYAHRVSNCLSVLNMNRKPRVTRHPRKVSKMKRRDHSKQKEIALAWTEIMLVNDKNFKKNQLELVSSD